MPPTVDYDWSRLGVVIPMLPKPDLVKFAKGLIINPAHIARIIIDPRHSDYRIKIHYRPECGGGHFNVVQGPEAEAMVAKFSDPAVWSQLGLNFVDFTKIPCNYKPEEAPARSIEL